MGVRNKINRSRLALIPDLFGSANKTSREKTLFIHWEQGLGDLIQFCRYAKLAADLGARVILEAPKPLMSLLTTLSGVAQFDRSRKSVAAF